MTQPTVSSTEEQQLVSPPGKGPIPPGQALYQGKRSKYIKKQLHIHSTTTSKDREVLGGLRARHNEIKAQSSRPTWKNCSYDCAMCIAEMLHNTIAQRQFCYQTTNCETLLNGTWLTASLTMAQQFGCRQALSSTKCELVLPLALPYSVNTSHWFSSLEHLQYIQR